MSKFSVYKFLEKTLREAEKEMQVDPAAQGQPPQPPQQTPEQVGDQQKAKGPAQNEPFKELTGQTVTSVAFQPNGANGGIISIKTKNSHLPFKISWVNTKVTVQDTKGNVINLSE